MRFYLRTILVGLLTTSLTFSPAVACHNWGCGEVNVEPCGSGCGGDCGSGCGDCSDCGPCETVVDDCCSAGTPAGSPATRSDEMPAPQPPAVPSPSMGAEQLMPPQVPDTHVHKPLPVPPAMVPTQPAAEPGQPAEEGADALFGPSTEDPAAEAGDTDELFPAEEETIEVIEETTEPADSGDVDSLFGEPETAPAEETEPAAPAEEEGGLDDLFSSPAAEEATEEATEEPTEVVTEEVLEEVATPTEAATPAVDTAPAVDTTPVEEAAPADEAAPAEEEKEDESFDDLFSSVDVVLSEAGGLASTGLRRWVDNTGEFSCRGRLIDLRDGRAKLLKDNGRTATVPLDRLSQADLNFVHRQASAQRAAADQTVLVSPSRTGN